MSIINKYKVVSFASIFCLSSVAVYANPPSTQKPILEMRIQEVGANYLVRHMHDQGGFYRVRHVSVGPVVKDEYGKFHISSEIIFDDDSGCSYQTINTECQADTLIGNPSCAISFHPCQ